MLLVLFILCVIVCSGDGSKVGSATFAGRGSRSRQGGAAQPAGGGEEVGGLTSPAARTQYCLWKVINVFHLSLSNMYSRGTFRRNVIIVPV